MSVKSIASVSSIGANFEWFDSLGWKRGFSWNEGGTICGVAASNEQARTGSAAFAPPTRGSFLCRGGRGSRGKITPKFAGDDRTDGVWMSWWIDSPADVERLHSIAVESKMIVTYPPTLEPWRMREFHLRHPNGHMFRVSAGLGET